MHIQMEPARPPTRRRVKVLICPLIVLRIRGRMRPEFRRTNPEIIVRCRLVPEHLVLQLVRFRIIVNHEALKVLRALVHNLTKRIKIRKHTGILVIQFPPIVDDVLTQNEDVVDVRAQIRRNTHRILHRDDEHCVDVTPVHEQITDIPVTNPCLVIQTIIENQEISRVDNGRAPLGEVLGNLLGDELLALEHIRDNHRIVFLVDEHLGYEFSVELIRTLRAGNHRSTWEALVMPEEVLDQERLAGLTLPNQNHDLVVLDFCHVEFLEFEIEALLTPCTCLRHRLVAGAVFFLRFQTLFRITGLTSMRPLPAELRLYYLQRPPPSIDIMKKPATYFPSMENLFPSLVDQSTGSPTLAAKELAIDVSGSESIVEDLQTNTRRTVQTWNRLTHLVEPVKAMSGEYVLPDDGALPSFRAAWQTALRKINDPFNEAYTDAVFACMASRLVETGRTPHFCRFFGTANGRVPTYTYNITDDMGDIEGEDWYADGLKSGAFRIVAVDPYDPDVTAEVKEPWDDVRPRLLGKDAATVTASSSSSSSSSASVISSKGEQADDESSSVELEEADIEVSGTAVVRREAVELRRLPASAGAGAGAGAGPGASSVRSGSDSSEDEIEYKVILPNFPVQLTVLERCDGTLDDLMEDEVDDDATPDMRETKEQRWTAWMFQVVAGLAVAQQTYDFVHNDLHTNNVMWCGTGETHLYYHVTGAIGGDRFYKVPTFGRIMKIIDFGRATFRPPASSGDNRVWFPDAFAPDADAGHQYNCGPYFVQGEPKVLPNKSFDLCRLAVAMLETLWPEPVPLVEPRKVMTREPGRTQYETTSPLWNMMWLWLTDKHGKNMLLDPAGEERYPQFDLYCAIARDVQNAVPAQQLTLPLFDAVFRCRRKDIPADATIWKLQASPVKAK